MPDDRVVLLKEDFSDLPLGPIPNTYSPWGEYHCHPGEGRLGRWVEATTHYSWRTSGGIWRVAEDAGRRVMEATFATERSYPLLLTGEADWREYTAEVDLRPLSFAGPCGLVIGYQHSRDFLALLVTDGRLALVGRRHEELTELAGVAAAFDCETYRRLSVSCVRNAVQVALDGEELFEANNVQFPGGRVGLIANAPARFADVLVTADREATESATEGRERMARQIRDLRGQYPRPKLWKKLSTAGFGTDRNLRFGDIDGDGEIEIILAQHRRYLGSGDFCAITCLTAVDLAGEVLWQVGTPEPQVHETTADLCFQLHDLDGDGRAELVYTRDLRLIVADGATGETRLSVPTPATSPGPNVAGGYPLPRIIGDCLYFCDFSGDGQRDAIVLKDRYSQGWVYGPDLELKWSHQCKTGHYPASYDIDGDGREELMLGYTLLSPDGEALWELDAIDHADSIVMGPIREGRPPIIALAGSDAGFFLLDAQGSTLRHHPIGHAQTICVAKLRSETPGLQIAVNTYWGEPGITLILDDRGNVLEEFEPMHYACLLQPVNWTCDDTDLVLLSPHPREGGLIDGYGRRVVMFPDDGHPVLCSDVKDIDGDGIDEVLAWDYEAIWVYKPDPPPEKGRGDYPVRNALFSDSNYRGQLSFPRS